MCAVKIPSCEFDALREYILESKNRKVEVIVYGRRGECPISICLDGFYEISARVSMAIVDAVTRRLETQSERVRLGTQFYLQAYHGISKIFLQYRMSDHLLELERATYEVPEQIMRLVKFLEEEQEATVKFRFGHYPEDPFEYVEFVLSQHVEMAGCGIVSQCSQKASPSFNFIWRVCGVYLERIILNNPPIPYGSTYAVDFVLEEEDGIVYFRMYHKGQRFFSVEKDKLRGEKS